MLRHRVRYICVGLDPYEFFPDKVAIRNVTVMEFTSEDVVEATLYCDKDTVFDPSCDMSPFISHKQGEGFFEWMRSLESRKKTGSDEDFTEYVGVFEVSVTGSHIDRVYGAYWWD